jgi:alpha-1,2-mannosyltransferase
VIPLIAQYPDLLFYIVGSCRNAQDRARITALEQVVQSFGVEKNVSFVVNASQERVQELLSIASVGVHTMTDEHFGIGIIEYMASGVIPVAHNSAGPKMDIIVDYYGRKVGYLAETQKEYTKEIRGVLEMNEDRVNEIRISARAAVKERFSSEIFSAGIVNCVNELL